MIIILVDIFIILRVRKRAVIQPNVGTGHSQKSQQQRHLQLQMFVLMIASIAIFLITTLPIAIYRITSPRERNVSNSIVRIISVWVGLGWFQSLNYAVRLDVLFEIPFDMTFIWFLGQFLRSLPLVKPISSRIHSPNSVFVWWSTISSNYSWHNCHCSSYPYSTSSSLIICCCCCNMQCCLVITHSSNKIHSHQEQGSWQTSLFPLLCDIKRKDN